MKITLPFPPSALNPNRKHGRRWQAIYKAKKKYKEDCYAALLEQKVKKIDAEYLPLTITFHPPDRRRRDRDNMISAFKHGQDILSQVVGIDDSKFIPTYMVSTDTGGFVEIEINEEWL